MSKPESSITRRSFLLGVISTCALTNACDGKSDMFLSPVEPFLLGNIEDFNLGMTPFENLRISIEKRKSGVHTQLRALQLVCTHQSCALKVPNPASPGSTTEIIYTCPCHGAQFDREGQVLRGPATRPLRWIKLSASENGNVFLHPDEKVKAEWWLNVPS